MPSKAKALSVLNQGQNTSIPLLQLNKSESRGSVKYFLIVTLGRSKLLSAHLHLLAPHS
jgi:hypothetical protein